MRILALEPYYGGSHKAFLDGWIKHSRHMFSMLTLPAYHWKWRMRHSPMTFARQFATDEFKSQTWDMIWCSSMLDLACLTGLCREYIAALPKVVYFHENQFLYPVQHEDERDIHFALTNMTSALASTEVWFNSEFNRTTMLSGIRHLLEGMPDYSMEPISEMIEKKSWILPPGIDVFQSPARKSGGPLHILWIGRWEHDKNPDDFYQALKLLNARKVDFRLSILGKRYRNTPAVFTRLEDEFAGQLDHFGYEQTQSGYRSVLRGADVIVSTSHHEFFGLAVLEAVASGCRPVLPRRLVYPEIFDGALFFYDSRADSLADHLETLAGRLLRGESLGVDIEQSIPVARRYQWQIIGPKLDAAAERVAQIHGT